MERTEYFSRYHKERYKNPEFRERAKVYAKKHAPANQAFQKRKIARRKYWLSLYKIRKGCNICGWNFFASALEFDHIDRSTKKGNVSNMTKGTLKKLINEVRKCRVLCSNCHAGVTHGRD